MCETRDGGCVVDVDEALRKFGGGRKAEVLAGACPETNKREPLFLATNPEISRRPIVITSTSRQCLRSVKRIHLVRFISRFCSLYHLVMYLALIRTRINDEYPNNSISFLIKLPIPSWTFGYAGRSQFDYINILLFTLGLHRLFDLDIWSLIWRFSLRSNSRQVTTLPSPPVRRCRMNSHTVLAFVSFKESALVTLLTSQATTVFGAHLTRAW
jgi:hypothetical protein